VVGAAETETAAGLATGKSHRAATVSAHVAVHAKQLRVSDLSDGVRAGQRVAVRH